jgi:putative membrane protein
MGLANLVPGISGGTMLLVAGVYTQFIEALADLTRMKFKFRSLLVLGCIIVAAGLGILLFAGTVKDLVVGHRWIMYSLFIGLTLGGLPVVWHLARPATPGLILAAFLAFALMVGLALLQAYEVMGSGSTNFFMLLLAGLAGASAMILPGLSGGYLLLLMGQYVPILSAIDRFKEAIKARDLESGLDPALSVLLPVGVGVVAGVVLVGNLLKWLLERFPKPTLGVLIGLLLGSVVGLWPFQEGLMPVVGSLVKGQVVTTVSLTEIDPEDWPTQYFRPRAIQIAGSLGLIAIGFAATQGVALIGGSKSEPENQS